MSIEELNQKISVIISSDSTGNYKRDACKKLSVEYAISVLNSLEPSDGMMGVVDKIQELKQYLNDLH